MITTEQRKKEKQFDRKQLVFDSFGWMLLLVGIILIVIGFWYTPALESGIQAIGVVFILIAVGRIMHQFILRK
tara:strand:- start:3524 stop:3742 length:219 start_codon:yes stop_codon:yes gene_type:complete